MSHPIDGLAATANAPVLPGQPVSPGQPGAHTQGLGEESSVWFNLMPLMKATDGNPMHTLMRMTKKVGRVIPVKMGSQRVVLV